MRRLALVLTLAAAVAAPAGAQAWSPQQRDPAVPPGHRPPPGMCRVWIDGVPPGQQPAPTDCATAVRNRPANGRVIWGDDPRPRRKDTRDSARDRGQGKPRPGSADAWGDDERGDGRAGWWGAEGADGDARRDDPSWGGGPVDRYGSYYRPGSGICADRNRDGVCDDAQRGGEVCVDRDRDGVCDAVAGGSGYDGYARGGGDLPAMDAATRYRRGERSPDFLRWLGDQQVTARGVDTDRDGVPDRITWLGTDGQVMQVWRDRDHDGYADVVEFFRDGRVVRVVGQQ